MASQAQRKALILHSRYQKDFTWPYSTNRVIESQKVLAAVDFKFNDLTQLFMKAKLRDFKYPRFIQKIAFRRKRPYTRGKIGDGVFGIEDLRLHNLQHEALSRLFEAGLSVPEVALISRHRDYRVLARYTYLKADTLAMHSSFD